MAAAYVLIAIGSALAWISGLLNLGYDPALTLLSAPFFSSFVVVGMDLLHALIGDSHD